ncbi:MAG: ATP-binding protein [Salinibacter sp.]
MSAQAQSAPRIASVQPDPLVGSLDWKQLTIQGRGFEEGFAVRLHAEGVVDTVVEAPDRLTYVDPQTVRVRAVFGNEASEWAVQIIHPDSARSNAYPFSIEAPAPQIEVVRPLRRSQDGQAFKVTVQGPTLTSYSTVRWNGENLPTTPIKSSQDPNAVTIGLEATVSPDMVEGPGENAITVHTPPPGGGASPPTFFTVTTQPFYQTTWFYLGVVGIIVVAGLGLHWFRLKRVRERALERKVRERTEALRREKQKTEEQAERLKALDEARRHLFEDLSHELRTPLTMISTPLHTVLTDIDDALPEDALELLEAAHRNSKKLEELVDQVLELSRLETGDLSLETRPGDLVAFARETVRSFEPMAEQNNVQLRFRADPEQIPSNFDPEKLRSVLGNLIENALQRTPEGGKVLVRGERPDTETVTLHVSDTGPGIPDDEISDLFDRFQRREASDQHRSHVSSLGLSLAKELAELHGGTIEVESEPGLVSTFTLRLPIQEPEGKQGASSDERPSEEGRAETATVSFRRNRGRDPKENDPEGESSPNETPAGSSEDDRATILVVEDNPDMRTYLRNQLSDTYRIQEAQDGTDALETARAEPPDLILSDVMMPEMDGVELCRRIRNDDALRDVPVLLLTAKAGEEAEVKGLDAGADAGLFTAFRWLSLVLTTGSVVYGGATFFRDVYPTVQ